MKCAIGLCGHCQFGPSFVCRDGPVFAYERVRALLGAAGDLTMAAAPASRSSPSGSSPPATAASSACSTARTSCSRSPAPSRSPISPRRRAAMSRGRYDLSLVEGSITTPHDAERIQRGAARSRDVLVTIGACATAGGIQALRNFADVERVHRGRLCAARVHRHAGDLDADRRSRARSTSSCAAARSTSASCSRCSAPSSPAASPSRRRTASASSASCRATSA